MHVFYPFFIKMGVIFFKILLVIAPIFWILGEMEKFPRI